MRLITIFSLSAALFMHSAIAQNSDNYKEIPINLSADQGEYDAIAGRATYTGNVDITQGEMNLKGDKVVIHISEGEVTLIEAWGKLATFHYVAKNEPPIDGRGQYMKYTIASSTVEINGQAYVKQEKNETHGDTLTYNLAKEQVSGKRVKMTLTPKSGG